MDQGSNHLVLLVKNETGYANLIALVSKAFTEGFYSKPRIDLAILREACFNGSSEFVSNISSSLVSMAFNMQLLAWLGEAGVAAYSIILYFGFSFNAIFIGYSIGAAPLGSVSPSAITPPYTSSSTVTPV